MIYDLIIVGGGPAGITAGIYAARQKLNTLLITKAFGGQIARKTVDIENYPGFEKISGMDLIQNLEKHLRRFAINIETDSVIKVEKKDNFFSVLTERKSNFQTKAIIIASGVGSRLLRIPGEEEFIGRGVSFCSVCDGPLFSNKIVAIIGGGNAGFETAFFMSKVAQKVYLLESEPEVSADLENQERVRAIEKIKIMTNVSVKEIKGNKFVDSIIYQDKPLKEDSVLSVDGVFIEIGFLPAVLFLDKGLVDFNERQEIKINPQTGETKTAGLFAAGDVTNVRNKQIVIAAAEGAKAALSASQYLIKTGV